MYDIMMPNDRVDNPNTVSLDDVLSYISTYKGIVDTKSSEVSICPIIDERDTVLYLVNYQDGWELLSSDRRAPRVFAMSETGHIDMSYFSSNPALEDLYNNFVLNIKELRIKPDFERTGRDIGISWDDVLSSRSPGWELVSTEVIEVSDVRPHLTQTRWGQSYPWNIRAPYTNSNLTQHCLTGCVPVAASQVLYYLHNKIGVPAAAYHESSTCAYIPTGSPYLVLQPSDVQFDATTFSSDTWDNMPLTANESGSFTGVSTLMLQMGLSLGALYYQNKTSAFTSYISNVFLSLFAITSIGSSDVDFDIIAAQVFDNMPVILSISRNENNIRYGHAVIVDACKEDYQIIRKTYRRQIPSSGPNPIYEYKIEESEELTTRYVGINWGWNGSYMYDNSGVIWFATDAIAWNVGKVYTQLEYMIYGFSAQ